MGGRHMCRPRDRCMHRSPGGRMRPPERQNVGHMSKVGVVELLRRAFDLYRQNMRLVLGLTLPVVVIVIAVTALGLGELGASYHASLPGRDLYIEAAAGELVTA